MPAVVRQDNESDRKRERRADFWAHLVGLVATLATAGLGVYLVIVPGLQHLDLDTDPFAPKQITQTIVVTGPDGRTTRTVTTREASSFVESALTDGGVLLIYAGVVAIAAFLAGAVAQRAVLGRFDITVGPLSFPQVKQIAAESERAVEELKDQLATQKDATTKLAAATAEALESIGEDIDALREATTTDALRLQAIARALEQILSLTVEDVTAEEEAPPGIDVDVQLEGADTADETAEREEDSHD